MLKLFISQRNTLQIENWNQMVSVDFHAPWKHVYTKKSRIIKYIAFHKTTEAEPKQLRFSKHSHSLKFLCWHWTRRSTKHSNCKSLSSFYHSSYLPSDSPKLYSCAAKRKQNISKSKHNFQILWPGTPGSLSKSWTGELTCKDIHILSHEQIWNAPESANKV